MTELGLSQTEYLTMAVLSMDAPVTAEELAAKLDHTGHALGKDQLQATVAKELLSSSGKGLELAPRLK